MSRITTEKDPETGHTIFHYTYRHSIEVRLIGELYVIKASNKEEKGALPPLDLLELKSLRELIDCAVDEEEEKKS